MPPADQADVITALRLGWLMAEVRGRARPDSPAHILLSPMARGHWAPPLASERSPAEREVESQHALQAVAGQLNVDAKIPAKLITELSAAYTPPAGISPHFSGAMQSLGKGITTLRPQGDEQPSADYTKTWNTFANLIYHWDAAIQDSLLSRSDHLANAYEVGRAVAETFWALDPSAPATVVDAGSDKLLPNPVSWQFLLGDGRRSIISSLLGRLAPYFAPLTAPSVISSVEVWGTVVAERIKGSRKENTWWKAPDAQLKLSAQVANWYSLLVAGLDPQTLLKPYAVLRSWKIFKKTFRVFGLEMAIGLAGAGALAAFGLLTATSGHSEALKIVVAGLGLLGVTSASLQARLKATTQSVVGRLSQDLSTDLIANQITVTPSPQNLEQKHARQRAIAARTVTAPLPS